jgi:hypothetical protein
MQIMSQDSPETAQAVTNDSPAQLAREIADVLQESNVGLIERMIKVIGLERVQALLSVTLEEEQGAGMLRKDGKRRTPGGAFFYRVRGSIPAPERRKLWPYAKQKKAAAPEAASKQPAPEQPAPAPIPWATVQVIYKKISPIATEAKTMKLTLVGRPAKILKQPECVIISLVGKPPSSLPKGLPTVPDNANSTWAVFIVNKQWNKVAESMKNAEDQLIVEGYPVIKDGSNILLAQSCKSLLLEKAAKAPKAGQA